MKRKNKRLPCFTERFRSLQGERSNTEFADFLGLSRQTVGFYCNGDRVPDALTLIRLAQACSVSADWLLGLTNDRGERPTATEELGLSYEAVAQLKLLEGPPKEIFDIMLRTSEFRDFLRTLTMLYACALLHRVDELSARIEHQALESMEAQVRQALGANDAMIIYGDMVTELFMFKANHMLQKMIGAMLAHAEKEGASMEAG